MSSIEATITIELSDGSNPEQAISAIQNIVSQMNGKETHINVIQVDDPLSLSPIRATKWGTEGE